MAKWDEFLKAEEEVRRGLAGAGLARSTPKMPPEVEKAKAERNFFRLSGPHGEIPIECGVPMAYSLVRDAFHSIGVTMEQARHQLSVMHDISMQISTNADVVKFIHIPKGTVRDLGARAGEAGAAAAAASAPTPGPISMKSLADALEFFKAHKEG